MPPDGLARGKRSLALNLKKPEAVEVVKKLCERSDVLIEPYRKGVMEKLGLGPESLHKINPGLIYARLTGYGQAGPYAEKAGHDINYLAMSGILSKLGRPDSNPQAPVNLLADFGGGGLTCALGIAMALYERSRSGRGQVIDSSMVEGAAYLGTFLWKSRNQNYGFDLWGSGRGNNLLDGGFHFYDTYKTKDDKYVAVGALEPQFYAELLKGLNLEGQISQFGQPQPAARELVSKAFAAKTQDEWVAIFDKLDACVTPVLDLGSAHEHRHNAARQSFVGSSGGGDDSLREPSPAPRLSRTPGQVASARQPGVAENSVDVLREYGFAGVEVERLLRDGIVLQAPPAGSKL